VSVCEWNQVDRVGRSVGWCSTTVYTTSYRIVYIVVTAADARAKRFGVTERRSSDGGGVPVPPSPNLGFPSSWFNRLDPARGRWWAGRWLPVVCEKGRPLGVTAYSRLDCVRARVCACVLSLRSAGVCVCV